MDLCLKNVWLSHEISKGEVCDKNTQKNIVSCNKNTFKKNEKQICVIGMDRRKLLRKEIDKIKTLYPILQAAWMEPPHWQTKQTTARDSVRCSICKFATEQLTSLKYI